MAIPNESKLRIITISHQIIEYYLMKNDPFMKKDNRTIPHD